MTDFTPFITKFSTLTGLNPIVVKAWVGLEQGVNNNVLGVTSGGHLVTYASQDQAAIATAKLVNTSNLYSGIRASTSGSIADQALAIAKSPWHLGSTGLAKVGGIDPYYLGGFIRAGLLTQDSSTSSKNPSGGTSTPLTQLPNTATLISAPLAGTITLDKLLNLPASTPIDASTIKAIDAAITKLESAGTITHSVAQGLFNTVGGYGVATGHGGTSHTLGSVTVNLDSGQEPGPLQGMVPDIPGALMFIAVIFVGIVFIAIGGFVLKRTSA